jgi:tetratricopeptide (TPR) repeat protein
MKQRHGDDQAPATLDALIEAITVDAHGDAEKFWTFRQAFEDHIVVPCDAFVIGEPVSAIAFDYDGNERRGLTARCRRADGAEHVVAACDVVLPPSADAGRYLAAYRRWLGLGPNRETKASKRPHRQHKALTTDIDLRRPIELVALSVKDRAARCWLMTSDRAITLRASRLWDLVPGEIVVVKPRKQWSHAGHPYLSGEIESTRLDVAALGLVPLRLEDQGAWNPDEEYWGEPGEPIEEWAQPIIARGPRQAFEMEQVLPGADPDDPDSDPITESNELKDGGDPRNAHKILMKLCEADLRCLDAHAHLGNFVFDHRPAEAIRYYEVGLRIGELSLGDDFDGVLPWGHLDNRPFLRCMHNFGLCCWRLGRFEEAERIFDRMLWLNPSDHQGVRFLTGPVRERRAWEEWRDTR